MVSIGKVSFSAKCPFGRIGGLKIFWEKKIGCRVRNFSHFLCQKTTFFRFLDPPCFRSGGPKKKFGISLKFLHRKKFQVPPPQTVHLKIPSFLKSDATLIRRTRRLFGGFTQVLGFLSPTINNTILTCIAPSQSCPFHRLNLQNPVFCTLFQMLLESGKDGNGVLSLQVHILTSYWRTPA